MKKSYFWILHLVMIAVGAYFAADVVNLVVGSYLEASIAIPDRGRSPQSGVIPVAIRGRGLEYGSIVEGNIFNSELRFKKPEPVRPVELPPRIVAPVPKIPLDFILVGTIVGRTRSFAIIENKRTREQSLYRVGHILEGGARITNVARNRVVILRGEVVDVLEVAYIPNQKGQRGSQVMPSSRPPVPAAPVPMQGGGVRKVSKNQWVLDRQEVDGAIGNLPQLLTKARIIPNFNNGKPDGFRIFAISKGSLYAKIGLQNGDILHRVNGIDVKDPKNFMQIFEQLKDESQITVDLVRRNVKETFNYEIR
ncbi:MAG: type II secretion system protein GspC [Nitrospira sp.]